MTKKTETIVYTVFVESYYRPGMVYGVFLNVYEAIDYAEAIANKNTRDWDPPPNYIWANKLIKESPRTVGMTHTPRNLAYTWTASPQGLTEFSDFLSIEFGREGQIYVSARTLGKGVPIEN